MDERIAKTMAKRNAFLSVLKYYPELPLHNNAMELAACVRAQVHKRDVSLYTISKARTDVRDTCMTISQTARKLGVTTYEYILDRLAVNLKCLRLLN